MMATVIVPTYKREAPLRAVLGDLLRQDYEPYEIVVVDQTPRHELETERLLAGAEVKVRVIRRGTANLPAARNEGIREARGDVVIFVDDDARVEPSFVGAHMKNYGDPAVDAVAGSILGEQRRRTSELPAEFADPYLRAFCACWQYDRRIDVPHAPGGNMSFRRSLAADVGGFDEAYTGPGFREESDFFIRFRRAGHRIVYDPECWLIHPPAFQEGGCWEGFDGVAPVERYFNHAYFIFKNMPRTQWARMFSRSLRSHFLRRVTLAHPLRVPRAVCRFVSGWCRAWREAPRRSLLAGGADV